MANLPRTRWPALPNSFGWHGRGSRSILHIAEVHTQSPCPCRRRSLAHAQSGRKARYLQGLGFKALATTSAGFAFTQGLPDGGVSRATMLAHFREIAAATDVPVNADFEGGYADAPEGVAESVKLCIETGVAGLSIEDSTSDPAIPLYDFELALARVRA